MNPDELARLVADRLQRIVPPGFHVDAADGMLWYSCDEGWFPGQTNSYSVGCSGTYVRDNFPLHGDTLEDHIVGVCRQALDELQDYVDEASHDPWPGRVRPRSHEPRSANRCSIYGSPTLGRYSPNANPSRSILVKARPVARQVGVAGWGRQTDPGESARPVDHGTLRRCRSSEVSLGEWHSINVGNLTSQIGSGHATSGRADLLGPQ